MSFVPTKSSIRAETVAEFVNGSFNNMTLRDIPGIGPASERAFQDAGINTPAQLVAMYLSFVDSEDSTTQEVCQKFYDWAKPYMGRANTHDITFAIANYVDEKGMFQYNYN